MEGRVPEFRGKPELRRQVARLMADAVEEHPGADAYEFAGLTFQGEPIVAIWNDGRAKTYIPSEIE